MRTNKGNCLWSLHVYGRHGTNHLLLSLTYTHTLTHYMCELLQIHKSREREQEEGFINADIPIILLEQRMGYFIRPLNPTVSINVPIIKANKNIIRNGCLVV